MPVMNCEKFHLIQVYKFLKNVNLFFLLKFQVFETKIAVYTFDLESSTK